MLKETKKAQQSGTRNESRERQEWKLCFSPDEWQTAKQISSYFSRLTAQEAAGEHLVQEAESIRECDIQALETVQHLKELEAVVYDQVDFKHLIEFSGQKLCSLAKEGKLKTKFKITI